jgi:S1-C subfamily serine protease
VSGAPPTMPAISRAARALALSAAALAPACTGGSREGSGAAASAVASGQIVSDVLELIQGGARDFAIELPEDALVLRIRLECARADLDLHAWLGADEDGEGELRAESESGSEELWIDRFTHPPLRSGRWTMRVLWPHAEAPRVGEKRLERASYTLRADVFLPRTDGELVAGVAQASVLEPGTGGFRTFAVDVAEGARALRIDLLDTPSDLDLYMRHGGPAVRLDRDVAFAQHAWGLETLLLTREGDPPLEPGRWFVDVVDAVDPGRPSPFRILATLGEAPPSELLAIAPIEVDADGGPLALALACVVELAAGESLGSGTLVSEDGWILTNEHVVGHEEGTEVVVSVTRDLRLPPFETFRGRVVRADGERDLALVRIERGFYGQALPEGYRFPALAPERTGVPKIGDPLWVVGYPSTGGWGSRVSVTVTRGVVSGLEHSSFGALIKTDAEIAIGNSGGAALDGEGRFLGVPSSLVESGSGQIGFVHPLAAVPAEWWEMVRAGSDR